MTRGSWCVVFSIAFLLVGASGLVAQERVGMVTDVAGEVEVTSSEGQRNHPAIVLNGVIRIGRISSQSRRDSRRTVGEIGRCVGQCAVGKNDVFDVVEEDVVSAFVGAFGEVEQTISDADAYAEAQRCMRCYRIYSVVTQHPIPEGAA